METEKNTFVLSSVVAKKVLKLPFVYLQACGLLQLDI